MSIHSFFEAAALGLSSSKTSAYVMTACIGLHQPAESIALVIAFLKSNMSLPSMVTALSLFSGVALVGNLAGQVVNQMASSTVEGAIVAATAGTFIYVGATEVSSDIVAVDVHTVHGKKGGKSMAKHGKLWLTQNKP
jgi:zinc transporter 1/2/3